MNTHNIVCDFGKHKGELYTRLPISYLLWMVNNNHSRTEIAKAELKRRGTKTPNIDISGHAINRVCQRCYGILKDHKAFRSGLYTWLSSNGLKALNEGEKLKEDKFLYLGIKWQFDLTGCWPVLKTVMRDG